MSLSVVLAEDNLLVREGIASLLRASPDIRVAASCVDADGLRRAIVEHDPDVVVTDIRMPPLLADDGVRVAIELRRQRPTIGVVVLSSRDDPEYALALMEGGTARRAYLLKERVAQPGELLYAVREVAAGRSVVDQQVVQRLLQAGRPLDSPLSRLSPRETEVLAGMAEGRTTRSSPTGCSSPCEGWNGTSTRSSPSSTSPGTRITTTECARS
ncbi:MAG TPA: response regulator transcription factor [Nakamurella sp.]|jgi:DNA-binding NarL/FixJ family response regulator